MSIPLIDFDRWYHGSPEERGEVARKLADACRRVGFVYIVNHGVHSELLDEAFSWSRKLFDLPEEKKMLAPHPPGPTVHRGYSWPGLEKVSQYIHTDGEDADEEDAKLRQVQDYKESYEIGSESLPTQPNQWLPEPVLPGFRAFMTAFYWHCHATAAEVLRALAAGIGLKPGDETENLLRLHSGHNNQLRLLHYPPVEAARLVEAESRSSGGAAVALARMPAHSDWGTITLLFQDNCGGLQVESAAGPPGTFVDVVPIEGAVVVNVGDLLMRWSNDYLRSTLHRVTLPPLAPEQEGTAATMTRARYSIPYFVSPDPNAVVECLPGCAGVDNPAKYPPVVQEDYRRMRGKLQYPDKAAPPAARA